MKITLLYFLISTLGFLSPGPTEPKQNKGDIVVNTGHLIINEVPIAQNWLTNQFQTALGNAETTDDRKLGYENKGLVLWREGNDFEEVSEFKINFFELDENKYWDTKSSYQGTITIEGIFINSTTTPDQLKSQLPQYKWEKNSSDWWSGEFENIGILISYDKQEKTIQWIDFALKND
jgi:hypothetical protein